MADNNMTENKKPSILDFGDPEKKNSIIKVIGVGGGGGNAVNHMYREGIHDVTFVLCNTDAQALNDSPVPVHLQLGKEGLGAGNRPTRAREAAMESINEIRHMLDDGTKDDLHHRRHGWWHRHRCGTGHRRGEQGHGYPHGWHCHHPLPF
jgi:cell division protein FtsZ